MQGAPLKMGKLTKPDDDRGSGSNITLVITTVIVIVLVYYLVHRFGKDAETRVEPETTDADFNVEEEVEKLRKAQDRYVSEV